MMTLRQVAAEVMVSMPTIYRWLKSGKLKAVKMGKVWRVGEDEVERLKKEGVSYKEG